MSQQNQANNIDDNGNIQLHLNANISRMSYAIITSGSPVRTQSPAEMPRILQQQPKPQLQLGDIYEFHSSPEEDNNFSSIPGSSFLPLANPTAICSQQKSSSASSIPNILASASTSCPPPKRIKTAVLAKKLLAAAAVIDPSKLPKSEDRKNILTETIVGEKELDKTGDEAAMENLIEENEKEDGDVMDEMEGTIEEDLLQQKQRAISISSTVSQEQKKVPPLRISLLKTPSEENGEQPKASTSSSSPCGATSNASRKTRGAIRISSGGGLRKVGGGGGHESKKDNLQRVTRSKVKQINSSNEPGDIQHGRKRRNRGIAAERGGNIELEEEMGEIANNSSSTLSIRTFAPFEEEEDNSSMNAIVDEGGIPENEKTTTTIRRNNSILGDEHRNGNEESQQQNKNSEMSNSGAAEMEKAAAKPSAASIMLNKNSLEQTFGFESMMREKWTKQYKAHLAHVIDKVNNAKFVKDPQPNNPFQFNNSKSEPSKSSNNEWPEPLKKLYAEQEKRRQELAEEHRLDRERIQGMLQREIVRYVEANSQQSGNLLSIVSYLRDCECYDPTLLSKSLNRISPIYHPINRFQNQTMQQIQQRFTYLANTTKNRHTLEAQALAGNQKAEWQRIARRIQRENEQRQLMLKGPIGSGAVGKQQQKLTTISFSPDLWAESAVNQIAIPDIQFPTQFQKCS